MADCKDAGERAVRGGGSRHPHGGTARECSMLSCFARGCSARLRASISSRSTIERGALDPLSGPGCTSRRARDADVVADIPRFVRAAGEKQHVDRLWMAGCAGPSSRARRSREEKWMAFGLSSSQGWCGVVSRRQIMLGGRRKANRCSWRGALQRPIRDPGESDDGRRTQACLDNGLTSVSGGVTLAYDPPSRLASVIGSAGTTQFLYDGSEVIAEYDGSATPVLLRRYVRGPGADEPLVWYEGAGTTNRHWLLADERGSVIAVTDGTGTVTQINKYDPYGVPDSENAGRFQFTGQMWIPEVKLYHFKARAYHPGLGRFLQPDPSGFAGGPNLYAYASDDPVNEIDSTGLCSQMQDSNGNPLTPWSCRNDNCGFLDCTPEPPPNALANLFYSLGPPEFTQQIPCLAGVGCYVPPGGTVPPEAASPQKNQNPDPCQFVAAATQQSPAPANGDSSALGTASDITSGVSATSGWTAEHPTADLSAQNLRDVRTTATGLGWAARGLTVLDIVNTPSPADRFYKGFDAFFGEALSYVFGPLGTAGGVAWSQSGGIKARGPQNAGAGLGLIAQSCYWSKK